MLETKTYSPGSEGDMYQKYDTSLPALQNGATGNAHYDCWKFDAEDTLFLCYLAADRDPESAEAALDRLRSLLAEEETLTHHVQIYQTAMLIALGSEDATLKAAAQDLLLAVESYGITAHSCERVTLTQSTGFLELDDLLGSVVANLKKVFGERLLSCYAVGSAFDGSGVQSSDVDLHLLFKGAHSSYLKRAVQEFSLVLSEKHGVDLDLITFFESDINPWADVRTKLGGLQIFGDCSAEILVLPPIEEYVRESMHKAYYYLARVRGFPDRLCYPLFAPNPEDRFYGYNSRIHEDGSPSTKELVVVAGWLSTALVTRAAQCYIASKSATYAGYCKHINDEWTSHLQDIFELAREKWNYRLPETQGDREKLAAICRQQVAFENHFLSEYRKFLEGETTTAAGLHADRADKLLCELFPDWHGKQKQTSKSGFLVPAWQISTKQCKLDPRLTSVDHFIVKVPSLRNPGNKALREALQRFDQFGVVVFACKDTLNLKYDLLSLQNYFGQIIFHPRSDKTGISSVRNLFKPQQGFVGTTNSMQTLHTDGSFLRHPPGIVALQAEICGLCGGESTLVFGDALYNYMEQEHPDDLEILFQDNAYTIGRGGDQCTRPVFWHEANRIHLAFRCGNGEHLEILPKARRSFRQVYEFVNARANQLRFRLPANHVLVVDNRRNLHGRLGWPPDTVRCLNRLWLDGLGTHPCYPGLGIRS
jgi:alpha-ketoglutarate-dependent taurine dioxygenase